MQDLYNISWEAFIFFLDEIDNKYNGKTKVIKQIIIDVLTNKNSIFNNDLQKYIALCSYSLETCKRIIMLTFVSKSYIMNYYDFNHEINLSYCQDMLDELEKLTQEEILDLFYKPIELTNDIIDDVLSYMTRTYIFQSKSKENIIENDKLKTLLQINPFEILDIWDYIPDDKLTVPEKYIQIFFDIFDKSLSEAAEDPNRESENLDVYEYELMIQNIFDFFEDDYDKITLFVSYILSNVYEILIIEKNTKDSFYEGYFDLISYLEKENIESLTDKFINDNKFGLRIIDVFNTANETLGEGVLLDKRETFKQYGNPLLLKRLNPYYDQEEIIFEQIKGTSR